MSRWTKFLLMICLGAAGGLAYGWYLNPVKLIEASPASLRIDYKTDYVLMVAEAYSHDQDLALAQERLSALSAQPGATSAQAVVAQAIDFAGPRYAQSDVFLMRSLQSDLATGPETPSP